MSDTIAALATPPGRGGIGIIRVSGSQVTAIAQALLGKLPEPRYASFSVFKDHHNQVIDQGLVIFFPGPHSFTGEDVLELHGHGGPAVMDILLKHILSFPVRLARPGEFSERAFLNGKIDLIQAEAIADLIDSASEASARASIRSLQGVFSERIQQLLKCLIHLRMYVEASIDFIEEEINFLTGGQIAQDLNHLLKQLTAIQQEANQGSLLRDGITVVIAGRPNTGKSTLLNTLSGHEAAIVTAIPGTTRDVLRERIVLDGLPLQIIDTAGIRESQDQIEQEGMRRAEAEIQRADLILLMTEAGKEEKISLHLSDKIPVITIRNKIDLLNEKPSRVEKNGELIISLSAKNRSGMDLLKQAIFSIAGFQQPSEGTYSARRRHLDALNRAKQFLLNSQNQNAPELFAEDLRQAQQALSEMTGEFTSDDLLGHIFSSFCIGK